MADRPFEQPLPADLPEDWTSGQTIAPAGADVGLSEQHGYNYLMEQVNAAQRALNAVNESFDTISGKRTCRFVVGTSAAGWTQADCDYLCDGTDDQVEIQAAIDAAPLYGCEIVLLDGTYHLSGAINLDFDVWLHGCGPSTQLIRDTVEGTSNLNYMVSLYPGAVLSDLLYDGGGKAEDGSFEVVTNNGTVRNVEFFNCGYGCVYVDSRGASGELNQIVNCVCNGSGRTFVFARIPLLLNWAVIAGNSIFGTPYLVDCPDLSHVEHGSKIYISGNAAQARFGAVSLRMNDSASSESSVVISGNILSKIEIQCPENVDMSHVQGALIYGNRLTGVRGNSDGIDSAAITLGSNTARNLVFGNMLFFLSEKLTVLDQGSGNIVFGNSDTPGGGETVGGTAGVTSFKGRSGAVVPQLGDYTAEMVGAIPAGSVAAIQAVTQAQYDALTTKDAATLYLIKE